MCAISGFICLNSKEEDLKSIEVQVRNALKQSIHRGPDHTGIAVLRDAVIGHNRLKITDLSDDANQPMSDISGRYQIVFNGEIFLHDTLRKELEAAGAVFRTHSDTEVLLYALIKYGSDALNLVNGFFSFAFFDRQDNSWIIARDRFGEKPLFYYHADDGLCFASELRALMQYSIPKKVDFTALSIFLQFTYIPAPSTILKGVQKLMTGQLIKITGVGNKPEVSVETWYTFKKQEAPKDRNGIITEFKTLLENATSERLHSDVPLGCFLSGGMDSSIIAMLASRHTNKLQTFSIGFPDQPFLDETKNAEEVANHIGSAHQTIRLEAKSLGEEAENVWNSMDEPFSDPSAMALWLLARESSKSIKVALSGDGADELLGGYNKHEALLRSSLDNLANEWLPNLSPIIEVLPSGRNTAFSNKMRQLKRYTKGLEKNIKSRYLYWSSFAEGSYHEDLLTDLNHVDKGARVNMFIQDIRRDDINSILYADQQFVLPGDMLTKVDTMTMAHGLEVRPPFLDHRVVEFVNALDPGYKITLNKRKILLHECFAADLPATVFSRPKKGFEIPLEKLLRTVLKERVHDLLSTARIEAQGIFKPEVVTELLQDFYRFRRSTHTSLIYSILVFQVWHLRYLHHS